MAVSVDTVYQRVLAILNKEQRGYITPQEFNLFANQVELDIFEQYFYDINQFGRISGNDTEFSDMLNILNEKINIFETTANMVWNTNTLHWGAPADLYRIGSIVYENTITTKSLYPTPNTVVTTKVPVEAERITYNEYIAIAQSGMTKPTNSRPVFVAGSLGYKVYGASEVTLTDVKCNYIKKPTKTAWGYQMVLGEALYNAASSTNFELHESEETELVIKILALSGLVVNDVQMYQIAAGMEAQTNQQEKS
jgi:hypothetical protein